MDPETGAVAEKDFQRALQELRDGNVLAALACLERALKIWDDPGWYSSLGYCIAKERGHVTQGFELCHQAIKHEPENSVHYLYLGKVHLLAGNKIEALETLRQGMSKGSSPDIERLLVAIGTRKPSVLSFLSRDNPVNKYLGIIFARLGLR